MESKPLQLSDDELKEWYSGADTQRVLGNICKHERKLLNAIEAELEKRGFEYQLDY